MRANNFLNVKNNRKKYHKICAKISVNILQKRISMNKTQKEFAKYMNVSQGMVSKWESGEYNFTIKNIADIFDKLDLNVDLIIDENTKSNIIDFENSLNFSTTIIADSDISKENELAFVG